MGEVTRKLESVLPEDTTDTNAMNEFVNLGIEYIEDGNTEEVIGLLENLKGEGRAETAHLTGLGQEDFYSHFANTLLGKYSTKEAPNYDERDNVCLNTRIAFSEPLWESFVREHSDIDHEVAKSSFRGFSNGWSGSRPESAPLQEHALQITGNKNAFPEQEWWDSTVVPYNDLRPVAEYSEFQQNFIRETFKPEEDLIYGFRSFKDEEVLEENSEKRPDGSIELQSAPIEHWSPSPSASAHYARDSNGEDHGYIIVDKIPVDDILGAGVASSAFAMNLPEMIVARDETEVYSGDQVIPYEEADIIELSCKAISQVGEVPENLSEKYEI